MQDLHLGVRSNVGVFSLTLRTNKDNKFQVSRQRFELLITTHLLVHTLKAGSAEEVPVAASVLSRNTTWCGSRRMVKDLAVFYVNDGTCRTAADVYFTRSSHMLLAPRLLQDMISDAHKR